MTTFHYINENEKPHFDWWISDPRRKIVLERLNELGVGIDFKEEHLTLWLKYGWENRAYLEIGYLLAQLTDGQYPDDFFETIAERKSKIFQEEHAEKSQPLQFRDNHPHGMKFWLKRGLGKQTN